MEITEYLREIGKRGGESKSQAKGDAARETLARVRAKRWPVKTDAVAVEGYKASVRPAHALGCGCVMCKMQTQGKAAK
jgi:hypothetical protein